jgi:hypothetical protein
MTNLINWIKKHWVVSLLLSPVVLLILYVLYVFIIFALINIIDRSAYNSDYSKLPKPYSQRGEPLPPTDVPVTLPPDPGEAGKKTLAGIDSNNDGVRDDLEREIVYMYPQNEEVRRVLRAMVKKGQEVITTEGDHEHFKELMIAYFLYKNCNNFLTGGAVNVNRDFTKTDILWSMLQNTKARKKIFETNSKKALPYAVVVDSSCYYVKGSY